MYLFKAISDMSLPIFQTPDRILSQLQTQWNAQISPVIEQPLVRGHLINNITLISGTNVIDHRLSRKLQGYIVVLKSANVTIYDNQSTNPMPDKTLILVASGPATISAWVF